MAEFVGLAVGIPGACMALEGVCSRIKKRRRAYKRNAAELDEVRARVVTTILLFRNVQGRAADNGDADMLEICEPKLARLEQLRDELGDLHDVERGRRPLARFHKAMSVKRAIESALIQVREGEDVGQCAIVQMQLLEWQAEQRRWELTRWRRETARDCAEMEFRCRAFEELSRLGARRREAEIGRGGEGLVRGRDGAQIRLVVVWIARRKWFAFFF